MPDASAMSSYAALCGDELWNQARLQAYVRNGITPNNYDVRWPGCEGLINILPCIGSEPPEDGYCLPETDDAPWYDPAVPESRDFAGLLVLDVKVSAPYSRKVIDNVGNGSTLGRLRSEGRLITVRGWLIGKTCCATAYGLRWLTSALDSGCGGGGCDGCALDFLACCPSTDLDTKCVDETCGRADQATEYSRGSDFWRRYRGVGVTDGPNILSCRGASCGCACGALLEVEFSFATSSPYLFSLENTIVDGAIIGGDCSGDCAIQWCLGEMDCTECGACSTEVSCEDDPTCTSPEIPPVPVIQGSGCGCFAQEVSEASFVVSSVREWSTSTMNISLYAGNKPLRNARVEIVSNPMDRPCSDFDSDCDSCASILVSYVPAYGTLTISGEERRVTVSCSGTIRNALGSVANSHGAGFDWPDIACQNMCVKVITDCSNTAPDATVTIGVVNRDL